MIYTDSGLINKDGSINLQYAFEWMCVLKEEYDMREFLKDMNDIEWLLSASVDKIDLMQAKFDELSGKYSLYVNIVNIFNYRRGMNRIKSSLREQLRLYYYHLPLFALLKHQVTKVFELEVNKMICECA